MYTSAASPTRFVSTCKLVAALLVGFSIVNHLPQGIAQQAGTELETPKETPPAAAEESSPAAEASDAAMSAPQDSPPPNDYVPAIRLLPNTVAGLARIPNVPDFCVAWRQTHFGQLLDDPLMEPFIEAQRNRAKRYLDTIENRVGLKPDDIYHIASGEAVAAWLPFENDTRRPFSMVVIADVRGRAKEANEAIEKIDEELIASGATRSDSVHRGQTIRIYKPKQRPGQIKIEQIALTLDPTRIIAADRDTVVMDLIDTVAGEVKMESISELPDFRDVLTRSSRAIQGPFTEGGSTVAVEWFAHPFQMGRILREAFEVDRGTRVDIIKLLENQGFDAVRAAGGIVAIAGSRYDLLHRGFILAPPTTDQPSKYEKAARMLSLTNEDLGDLPSWIAADSASVGRLRIKIKEAFLASETLVNEAFGNDDIFIPTLDGIRDDADGPQIDIQKNVLPAIGDEIILVADNVLPLDTQSERMLVAIRLNDPEPIRNAIQKAMEVEPDAVEVDSVPGVEIWKVQRGESSENFEEEIFGDLGFEDEDVEKAVPLLEHWAIAMVPKGPKTEFPYLMFSSHPELLIETAQRIQQGEEGGFANLPEVKQVIDSLADLGAEKVSLARVVKTDLSLRAKYELFRQGKLRDNDSILATVIRRLFEDENQVDPAELNAAKLPPLDQIKKHFPMGGNYTATEKDGWSLNGFLLK